MTSNGRPPGVVETRERSKMAVLPVAQFTRAQVMSKWIVWQGQVYCIGDMEPIDYEKFVRSFATSEYLVEILLKGIDDWSDSYSRYYTAMELLNRKKIRLYDTRKEAEQARRAAA